MALFPFARRPATRTSAGLAELLKGHSIEVLPRTAAKVARFSEILPEGTRVYVAHVDGTPFEEMLATCRRIAEEGFEVMPHLPARSITDRAQLADWIARYAGEAGVTGGLILAGGNAEPRGCFENSMQLLETGFFDRAGFTRLHVAGHPEGSRDIDPDGSDRMVTEALRWKQAFSDRTDAQMALVTQFLFDAGPVLEWTSRLKAEGIALPVHLGIAGPAKLQTLIKYAVACGVGPSFRVLQKRAMDVTKLMLPYEPTEMLEEIAGAPDHGVAQIHIFPLGGIGVAADWTRAITGVPTRARATGR